MPNGSIGFRWGEKGEWNLEERAAEVVVLGRQRRIPDQDAGVAVASPQPGAHLAPVRELDAERQRDQLADHVVEQRLELGVLRGDERFRASR